MHVYVLRVFTSTRKLCAHLTLKIYKQHITCIYNGKPIAALCGNVFMDGVIACITVIQGKVCPGLGHTVYTT